MQRHHSQSFQSISLIKLYPQTGNEQSGAACLILLQGGVDDKCG